MVQNLQLEILVNLKSVWANRHRMGKEATLLSTNALISHNELYTSQESTMLVFKPLHGIYTYYGNCTI